MLILLGLVAILSISEITGEVASIVLAPLAAHVARRASAKLADYAPDTHAYAAAALGAARARLARWRGLRDVIISTRLLRGPAPGSPNAWGEAWDDGETPCVEALLQAVPVACDLARLRFRDPSVRIRLPLASVAPLIGMRAGDILEVRGLDIRGKPWARCFRASDQIELPLLPPAPPAFSAGIANASVQRDGQFVADISAIARTWAPAAKDLRAVAPFVVRDAMAREDDTFEKLLVGHSSDCPPDAAALAVHSLATDLSVDAIEIPCSKLHFMA